jgi:hypothetical protein
MSKANALSKLTIKVSKDDLELFTDILYQDIADPALNGVNTHAADLAAHGLTTRFAAVDADIDLIWDELNTKVGLNDIDLSTKADKAGDTFTGTVKISTLQDHLVINGASETRRGIYSTTSDKKRWEISLATNETEGAENSGSNFSIARYNDNGGFMGFPLSIDRSTGITTIENLVIGGDLLEEDSLDIRQHPWEPTENLRRGTVWLRTTVVP